MTLPALILSALIGFLSLARGFYEDGWLGFRNWIFLYGVLWTAAIWKQWKWFPSFALFASISLAIIGVTKGAPFHWMMAGAAGALLYWDISNFRLQMAYLPSREDVQGLARRRFLRLTVITFVALIFVTALSTFQGTISRPWYLLLAFIFALTLAQFIAWIFRKK